MERRYEELQNATMAAASLAEYDVAVWLLNDRPVYERARNILAGLDTYAPRTPGGDVTERLAAFIEMLLYTDDGSTYRAMHRRTYGSLAGFESHVPGLVRLSFTRSDFDRIDWKAMAEELKGHRDER